MLDFHFTCSEKNRKKEPDSDSTKIQIEYVKLWMEQSKLFWSRLQTAAALHTAVLGAWYLIRQKNESEFVWLAPCLLWLGLALSIPILLIMWKDGLYMDAMRDKADEGEKKFFPKSKCDCAIGRFSGFVLLLGLMLVEVVLLHLF